MVELFGSLADETRHPAGRRRLRDATGPAAGPRIRPLRAGRRRVAALVERYRELYADVVDPDHDRPLPGALEAVKSVAERDGDVIVVTAKFQPTAVRHLDALGIEVQAVVGDVWSAGKAAALTEHGAEVFVGDHLGDITGARAADALSVGGGHRADLGRGSRRRRRRRGAPGSDPVPGVARHLPAGDGPLIRALRAVRSGFGRRGRCGRFSRRSVLCRPARFAAVRPWSRRRCPPTRRRTRSERAGR